MDAGYFLSVREIKGDVFCHLLEETEGEWQSKPKGWKEFSHVEVQLPVPWIKELNIPKKTLHWGVGVNRLWGRHPDNLLLCDLLQE